MSARSLLDHDAFYTFPAENPPISQDIPQDPPRLAKPHMVALVMQCDISARI